MLMLLLLLLLLFIRTHFSLHSFHRQPDTIERGSEEKRRLSGEQRRQQQQQFDCWLKT
jgi:hypothetical protein